MMDRWDDWQPSLPPGDRRHLGWLALLCLLIGALLLASIGCAPRCRTLLVGYTDYDDAGAVIGHRTQAYQVCQR